MGAAQNVAFIRARLQIGHKFDDFKRSLGIDKDSRFSESIQPARHRTIEIIADYETSLPEPSLVHRARVWWQPIFWRRNPRQYRSLRARDRE